MSAHRIYAASLSDYSAGRHHGRWIDCLDGPESVQADIDSMLASSPTAKETGIPAEEWAVHDHEFEDVTISEHCTDVEKLCALAEAIEEHGETFAAFWDYRFSYSSSDVAEAVEAFEDAYQGTFPSLQDWAEDYAENSGLLDGMPQHIRSYFDFERFSRDCEINGDIWSHDVSDGVAVFHN